MITIRVDRCPECDSSGQQRMSGSHDIYHDCLRCDGLGFLVPAGFPWIKVPMVNSVPPLRPHPAWQPGVSVTLTADHNTAWQFGSTQWRHVGQIVVAEYVITELVPVLDKDIKGEAPDIYVYVLASDRRKWLFDHGNETPIDVDCVPGDLLARLETP